jgi:AAA family ATP:ADP antiporter
MTTTLQPVSSMSKLRQVVFPIYGNQEVTKFLLLGSIKFFIILVLTLTRDTKDTLVVTQCGAEAIAFLKIYGVLPAATAFIALYGFMADRLPKKMLFYATCVPFFSFFLLFDLFVYPNVNSLHPSLKTVEKFFGASASSGGMAVMVNICAHWTSALFYIVSEIYSSVSVGLLFWQFANDVVNMDQAKRFYPLFAQMSGLAPILAGQYVVRYSSKANDFGTSMHRLTAAVTAAGVMICLFYRLATNFIERTEHKTEIKDETIPKKKKQKLSMTESAKFLASSQYLRLIATLVLGYGLSINFTEIMWKSLVKKQYPNPLEYSRFMGNFSSAVGLSTCIVIFFGVHVIRILGWKVGAMATPVIMAVLAVPFFACILFGLDSPSSLRIAVVFGTIQSLLSKTSKYALFDPTTQMAYIPLDDESKIKGKAAIDVLGSRIGKSGGSFIQQGLVLLFGSILNAAPVVGVIFYSVLFAWTAAASRLAGLFQAQTEAEKAARMEKSAKAE